MLHVISFIVAVVVCCGQASPTATPELAVKGAGSRGTLVFSTEGIEFRAASPDKSQRWRYSDIRDVRIDDPQHLVLDTYQTRSRWRFGRAKRTEFDVTAGAITGDVVAAILAHAPRAVVTSVLPAGIPEPTVTMPVSHRRFGTATQGTLEFGTVSLLYRSATGADSRFWRLADLQSVARTSPFEVLVTAYEGDGLHPYTFELKAPLPQEAYDAFWRQLNPSPLRDGGARSPGD
jgi:hypothetical protein